MENLREIIAQVVLGIEVIGVAIISLGIVICLIKYAFYFISKKETDYKQLRREIGKAILLGLEVLVAADIIHTVATEPTLRKVAILGGIVLIRTFLSFSLQMEVDGKSPWQRKIDAKSN